METESIPGYRIVRQIGRGGAATVYLAVQESLEREVALKVIPGAGDDTGDVAERFRREARTLAGLTHRNIVNVFDVGTVDGALYLSMEHLAGGSLRARDPGSLAPDESAGIVSDVAAALQHAHDMGIVHRDIKPQNIMFREDGTTVLTDFGIAKVAGASELTQNNTVIGTPYYMSPEQAKSAQVDGRSDLYSLGVVFYWLLVGRHPFESDSPFGQMMKHLTEPVPRLPAEVARFQPVIDRLMAKDPEERYQRGQDLVDALDVLASVEPRGRPGAPPPPSTDPAPKPPGLAAARVGGGVVMPAPSVEESPSEATQILPPTAWKPDGEDGGSGGVGAASMDETRLLRFGSGATTHPGGDLPVALAVVSAREAGRVGARIPCGAFPFVIGRTEGADLSFPSDPNLSRKHVVIDVDADGFVIRDLSTNGIYLNGRHLRGGSEPLLFGSSIVLSRTTSLSFVTDLPALPDLSGSATRRSLPPRGAAPREHQGRDVSGAGHAPSPCARGEDLRAQPAPPVAVPRGVPAARRAGGAPPAPAHREGARLR